MMEEYINLLEFYGPLFRDYLMHRLKEINPDATIENDMAIIGNIALPFENMMFPFLYTFGVNAKGEIEKRINTQLQDLEYATTQMAYVIHIQILAIQATLTRDVELADVLQKLFKVRVVVKD